MSRRGHRRWVGPDRTLNCLVAILLLLITGRLSAVYLSRHGWWFHFSGATRRGNFIDFIPVRGRWRSKLLWYVGSYEVGSPRLIRPQFWRVWGWR